MKHKDYSQDSLIHLDRELSVPTKIVTLTGQKLTIRDIASVARYQAKTKLSASSTLVKKIETGYRQMINQVEKGIPIYGCNTGYGAQAEKVLNQGTPSTRLRLARKISDSIVHTDIGVGPELSRDVIRGGILIRINMLINGASAVRLSDLEILRSLLNCGATPVINSFGGLGASGDLAHNQRVVSTLRRLSGTQIRDISGHLRPSSYLNRLHVPKLNLEPKAGLGLCNGDNFSTSAAALITLDTLHLTLVADVLGAMVIEVLKGTNRTFHPFLSYVRPHSCQAEIAQLYRSLLNGSKLAFQELSGPQKRPPGVNIQDAYSLRCLTQSESLNREIIKWSIQTVTTNANSISDNPLWVTPKHTTPGEIPWQWVSGGNFYALHMGEVIDSLRKIITRLIKRNDRHLHRMVNPHLSNGLPPNLSDPKALSSCTFKGIQLQSGMFDVYSSLLAQPVTTMFGSHEENNQDITPHSLTSAILAWENLRLLRYSLAMNLLAVAQAVDLRGGPKLLSPHTRPVYEFVRQHSRYVTTERPLNHDIENLSQRLSDGQFNSFLRSRVFVNL